MRSELLEKRIEEVRKRKKKLLEDIKLIDDALNGLDELEDFMKNFKYKIINYYNEVVLDGF
jgi:chaperonin cofactor prefoldin